MRLPSHFLKHVTVHNNRIRNCKFKSGEVRLIHSWILLSELQLSMLFVLQYPSFYSTSLRQIYGQGHFFLLGPSITKFFFPEISMLISNQVDEEVGWEWHDFGHLLEGSPVSFRTVLGPVVLCCPHKYESPSGQWTHARLFFRIIRTLTSAILA